MKDQTPTDLLLHNYTFKKDKPLFATETYSVYKATQNQTNLPVTIKILNNYHPQLPRYFKNMKDCRSQNVIKIYETTEDSSTIVLITEQVNYGNLHDALGKCNRLQDNDAIFMAKMILNGYVDLMRSDCKWFGSQKDIQFTEGGVKLSWNNSIDFTNFNPIPRILDQLSARSPNSTTETNLLPFPNNKILTELVRVSHQNGSEISMNQHMKKKEKMVKKKGKKWLAIKEYQNKNEYFTQIAYFAISEEYGAIRVKIFDEGKINKDILNLNKSKKTFTRVLQTYNENGKTIIISEYSNDGHLQNYVNKLKASNIILSEEQIQFFFYSMFEPLKQIQSSPLKSINMLNIRNIYLENGIPKIGQPIPMNPKIEEILADRSEVPDFYHPNFKSSPSSHQETYDTYSLGVLLYKLMFKEYPIFPKGKVHIPTTPTYQKKLKTTLQIFLNEGGKLKQIESRIEVSENVLKQVKQNKQKLVVEKKEVKKKQEGKKITMKQYDEKQEQTEREQKSESIHSEQEDHIGCCSLCCSQLQLSPNEQGAHKHWGVIGLQQSPYRVYRICTKTILTLILYIFVFYFFFLQNLFTYLVNNKDLGQEMVNIATVEYPIYHLNKDEFITSFGKTSGRVEDLVDLECFISNYGDNPDYSEILNKDSSGWVGFIYTALISLIIILTIKIWQINNFDIVRAIYNRDEKKYAFNISHFVVFHMLWSSLIYGHFYLYNFIFNGQVKPCLGGTDHYASTTTFLEDRDKFQQAYVTTFVCQVSVTILHCIMIGCTHRIRYNKLINPLMLLVPLWITEFVIMRVGVIDGYFWPNMRQEGSIIRNYFTSFQYLSILGIVPEIMIILELMLGLIIDFVYWIFLDKRRRLLINQTSSINIEAP